MTWQFIPFLILAGLLVFGMLKFRQYLAKKEAAHSANPDPAPPSVPQGGGAASAHGPHEVSK